MRQLIQQSGLVRRPHALREAGRILRGAVTSRRPSLMFRAQSPYEFVHVSSNVLVARLREEIDTTANASTAAVRLHTHRDSPRGGSSPEISIDLFVQYGASCHDALRTARLAADLVASELLGYHPSHLPQMVTNLRVRDVTVGDPHLLQPDEDPG